jgi:murein DD-endopeptidase MepM/ murein hydrolase activator NlpD
LIFKSSQATVRFLSLLFGYIYFCLEFLMKARHSESLEDKLKSWFQRFYPRFEVLFRSDGKINHIKISNEAQLSILVGIIFAVGWCIYASFSHFISHEVVVAKDKEIIRARMAYRELLSEVNNYQDKFSDLTSELSKNHGLMLNLVERNATLQQNVKSAVNKLETTKSSHKRIVVARINLKEKLSNIQAELKALNNHNFSLKGNLNTVTTDLESALSERNSAVAKSEKLSQTVEKLQNNLSSLNKTENEVLLNLMETTKADIKDIYYILKLAGFNVKKLKKLSGIEADKSIGKGGPFIPIKTTKDPASKLKSVINNLTLHLRERKKLRSLMGRMPFSSPLNYFTISSHFGKRRDPINKRWAVHTGLDFGGIKNSRVYATAPGIVSFAGRNGKYGKLVEIDHGFGLKTKYGHLNKILVKRGQKVDYRAKIGLMGSTGRSTGPHLHYEILVKGKHQNPWHFIKAGRYVYKR